MSNKIANPLSNTIANPICELDAAAMHWRSVELISDLHLQAEQPETFQAFQAYLAACTADALFILGDLFEAWIGDDVLDADPFAKACVEALAAVSSKRPVYLMVGNRDFLIGERYLNESGCQLLADPCLLRFEHESYLLSHGDALCYADTVYMQTRAVLRSPAWRENTLSKSLAERELMGKAVRAESQRQQSGVTEYADLDKPAILELLGKHQARTFIHGHTHRPQDETLSPKQRHIVLSDWDLTAHPPRAEVLQITNDGQAIRISLSPKKVLT